MALKKRVIIAAGHGGGDSGAVAQGTTEATETIQITGRVVDLLKKDGRIAVTHVPDSLGLQATIDWINARYKGLEDGLAIEVHKNSGGGTGSEVWTPSYPDSTIKGICTKIANSLASSTKLRNRGIKYAQDNRWGRLGFCDDVNTYACLIEAGFIDVDSNNSASDAKFAEGIFNGILSYFGLKPKVAAPAKPKTLPVPKAVKLKTPLKFTTKLSPTNVWNLATNPTYKPATVLRKGEVFEAYATITFNKSLYYVTKYSYDKGTPYGVNKADLVAYVEKPTPPPVVETYPPKEEVSKDDEQDKRLSAIEAFINSIKNFFTGSK